MQSLMTAPAIMQGLNSNLRSTTLRFRAGQLIFDEGQRASRWYEVVHGTVRTCRFHMDGHRHLTGFFFSGDVFGADYGNYGTAAEAVTDVVVRCYRVGDITDDSTPKKQLDEAVTILFRAMSTAQRYLFIMGHRTATEKLAAFLLCLKQQADGDSCIRIPMSRSDIADFLGLTVHTVSRTFTDLARRGLIKIDGRHSVIITDNSGLCSIAGEYHDSLAAEPETDIHPAAGLCLGELSAA
ncbi:helix-turn-helix domain-containing protein [Sphingorhabdus sp. Alg231-15]|uniref:helix-turn-helix domain-containing protein n=1 Tax=Sphingorhabdus sp. Alg231-15 TaxID=1922222 RepID=UPI000D55D5A4